MPTYPRRKTRILLQKTKPQQPPDTDTWRLLQGKCQPIKEYLSEVHQETNNQLFSVSEKQKELKIKLRKSLRKAIQDSSIQLNRDQQTFSAKDWTVNSLGFASHVVS